MGNVKEAKTKGGKILHYSVGALIERDGKYLLIDRKKPPLGFASIAGHMDEGETPMQSLVREVYEESNLRVNDAKLLFEEDVPWNVCSRGVKGHYWYVFACKVSGKVKRNVEEVRSIGWFTPLEIKKLRLELVWEYWLKKLKVIER